MFSCSAQWSARADRRVRWGPDSLPSFLHGPHLLAWVTALSSLYLHCRKQFDFESIVLNLSERAIVISPIRFSAFQISWVYFFKTTYPLILSSVRFGVSTRTLTMNITFQFSCSVMSYSLQPHESQHTRPPCPSPTPRVYSNSCSSSRWCHPAISSSVVPFSSCPQSLPASGSFPMSQLFSWGGQSIGVSTSASFLPMNTQDWSPLGWTGWISLQSKGLSRVFSKPQFKSINFGGLSFLHSPTLTSIHDHWKNHSLH